MIQTLAPRSKTLKEMAQDAAFYYADTIEYEEKALSIIAREGHGSMRDALTTLDSAIAVGQGRVTVESLGYLVSEDVIARRQH